MKQWCSDCNGSKFCSEPLSSILRSPPIDLPIPLGSSVPASFVHLLFLQEAHGGGLMGHFEVKKIEDVLAAHYVWPKMRHDVERYVSQCTTCNKANSRLNPHVLYMSLPVYSVP
jgi:hypothetical protein